MPVNRSPSHTRVACIAFVALVTGVSAASASEFTDVLVQPPSLGAPERGSVAGSLAKLSFGPGDVSRGSFQLGSPFGAPESRGSLLASVFPGYAPEAGLGEWGMGWSSNLAIRRQRLAGELDYATDDFASPWGRLQRGSDGWWYPKGLSARLRLRQVGGAWEAHDGGGTTYRFTERVDNERGTYAWYLTEVTTTYGDGTTLAYEANASGRVFLTDVWYGQRGHTRDQHISFRYESLDHEHKAYDSGAELVLDRRIDRVTVEVKHARTGAYQERWHHDVTYTESELGPAYYLHTVTKVYASGASEPPLTYTYDLGAQTLQTARFEAVPALDRYLGLAGSSALQPDRATMVDIDRDGRTDFEHAYSQTWVRQGDDSWTFAAAPAEPADVDRRCRPPVSASAKPRVLAHLTATSTEPRAVAAEYDGTRHQTDLVVCNRAGQRLREQTVPGQFELGPNTRLADVNRDHRPDLVWVYRTGDQLEVQVLENRSEGDRFAFHLAAPHALPYDHALTPQASWIHDFNGDQVADIVVRTDRRIVVFFGRGQLQYTEGRDFAFRTRSGTVVSGLAEYGTYWLDANKDGLTDALLTQGSRAYLFTNTGDAFVQRSVPGLSGLTAAMANPVIADLRGSGNAEILYVTGRVAQSLALNTARTGLLRTADDGNGTLVAFDYARAPAWTGVEQRSAVLSGLAIDQGGVDPVTFVYDYEEPVVHSVGRFVVGYGVTRKIGPFLMEEIRFHHDDDLTGIVEETLQTDGRTPGLVQFLRTTYEERTYQGLRFRRPNMTTSGWRSLSGETVLAETSEVELYEREVCPTRVRVEGQHGTLLRESVLDRITDFDDDLHCLAELERLTGIHSDAALDFSLEQSAIRNRKGQVTSASQRDGAASLVLQEVRYDASYRPEFITRPGYGTTEIRYDPATGLVGQVIAPDGVAQRAGERDPLSDAMRELVGDRGPSGVLTSQFRFDDMERLSRSWQDFGGSSESLPLSELSYLFPDHDRPGAILERGLIDADRGIVDESAALVGSDGESVASLGRIPEGWAVGDLVKRDLNNLEIASLRRSPLPAPTSFAVPTYAALEAGARSLSEERTAGFGHTTARRATVQSGVEQVVETTVDLSDGARVTTAVENGTYQVRSGHDLGGRLLWSEDQLGKVTSFDYDALGRVVAATLPGGATHAIAYDGFGRPDRVTRAKVGHVDYTYYPGTGLAHTKSFHDARGNLDRTVTFTYDGKGRVTEQRHSDRRDEDRRTFSFDYDGAGAGAGKKIDDWTVAKATPGQRGHLTRVTGDKFEREAFYNPDGSVRRAAVRLADWREVTTDYTYHASGAAKTVTTKIVNLQTGAEIERLALAYAYDRHGRLDTLSLNGAHLMQMYYDGEGRPDRVELRDGQTIAYSYDAVTGALSGYWRDAGGWNAGVDWSLDERGHVAQEQLAFGDQLWTREYRYDDRGFLSLARDREHFSAYEHTDDGRLSTVYDQEGSRNVAKVNEGVFRAGGKTYAVDSQGRVWLKDRIQLIYGPDGHLAEAISVGTSGKRWQYYHDEGGNRILKMRAGKPVAAYIDGAFLSESGMITPVRVHGLLVGVVENGRFQLLATDPRGTVLADRDGTPRLGSPFGVRARRPDLSEALDYVEKAYDADLGLVRMGVRDYDPFLGRFHTPDPLFLESIDHCAKSPVECNLYAYAANNPLSYTDPSGLDAEVKVHTRPVGTIPGKRTSFEWDLLQGAIPQEMASDKTSWSGSESITEVRYTVHLDDETKVLDKRLGYSIRAENGTSYWYTRQGVFIGRGRDAGCTSGIETPTGKLLKHSQLPALYDPGKLLSLTAGDAGLTQFAGNVKPIPGVFTIIGHGNPVLMAEGTGSGTVTYHAPDIAHLLSTNGHGGEPIVLISCHTGVSSSSLAQKVATLTGARTFGAHDFVIANRESGGFSAGERSGWRRFLDSAGFHRDEAWREFHP